MTSPRHAYEIRPRKDKRRLDLISEVLPFGRLWYGEPDAVSNAIGYAKFYNRSQDVVIRVFDEAANVNDTHKRGRLVQSAVKPFGCRNRSGFVIHHTALPIL